MSKSCFEKAICPMMVPLKCQLPDEEKEAILKDLKYRVFFMLDYDRRKEDPLIPTIREYFQHPYYLLEAREIASHREKICKICKIALACTCGVASLTPLNYNVFLEIGMLMSLGKPILYLFDLSQKKLKPEELPFDVSSKMLIIYRNKEELKSGLDREIDLFKDMIKPEMSLFQSDSREKLREKIIGLHVFQKEFIRSILLERTPTSTHEICLAHRVPPQMFEDLYFKFGILVQKGESGGIQIGNNLFRMHFYDINPELKDDLICFYEEGLLK